MESLIKLTVKTPNQRIDDFQIDCDLKWSVKKLKEYLQDVYPSKPASSSQKLIYLGKLLKDHDLLKEVFGEWGVRTLHLVCAENNVSGDEKSDSETTSNAPTTEKGTSQDVDVKYQTSASAAQEPSTVNPNIDATDGLRYRGNVYHSVPGNMSSMYSPFHTAATSMPNVAQWYHFQQQQQQQQHPWSHQHTHMQQYYQQMQQWQQWHMAMTSGQWPSQQTFQSVSPPSTPGTPPVVTPLTPQQSPPPQAAEPQAAQQQQQPAAAAPPQNIRMNAGVGGGAIADDDDDNENVQNRDWLDWMYMSMRVVMLLSIIYFYSSTSRFLMVALLGFIIYVYQAGWLTPRRRQPPPAPTPVPEQQQENNENNDSPPQDGDDTNTEPIVTEPPRPSAIRVLCTFFVSFLTSLIPTAPPALQQQ